MTDDQSFQQPENDNAKPALTETPAEKPRDPKIERTLEIGREYAKERAEVEQQRIKPGEDTLTAQQKAADEAFKQSIEEQVRATEAEMEAETGKDVTEEEIHEMKESLHEFFEHMSPAFAKYLRDLTPRLDHLIDETSALRKSGNDKEAIEKLVTFLEDEEKFITDNISEQELRENLLAYVGSALNADKIAEEMKSQTWKEVKSDVVDLVPIIGPVKMMCEAAKGNTAGGETLEGTGRAWHGAVAAGSLVIDGVAVAGILTGGTVSAVAEGGKVAASSGRIAGVAAKVGAGGIEIAGVVKRFAAITRSTVKMSRVAKGIYKCGTMMAKYPKLTATIAKLIEKREELMDLYDKSKHGHDFVSKFGHLPTVKSADMPAANDNSDTPESIAA